MTTTALARAIPVSHGSPAPRDQLGALLRRQLVTSTRVPQLLMFSLTMPMAMLVLFSQVFRSVAAGPGFPAGVDYIDFVTPAMLAVATVMAGTNVGVAAALDHTNGVHDRLATLPVSRHLPALARTINEAVFTLGRVVLLGGCAFALGCRFHGSALDATGAVLVLLALAAAMSTLFGRIGDRLGRPDVVQFAGMMIMMPFMFVSPAFAPLDTMPKWMQVLAEANPVTHAIDALRGHVLGTASLGDTATAVGAALALAAIASLRRPTRTVLRGTRRAAPAGVLAERAVRPLGRRVVDSGPGLDARERAGAASTADAGSTDSGVQR